MFLTMFIVLFLGFVFLLNRYCGKADIEINKDSSFIDVYRKGIGTSIINNMVVALFISGMIMVAVVGFFGGN